MIPGPGNFMKAYNSGLSSAQKVFGEKFSYETYFFFLEIISVQSDDVWNVWIEGPSYWGSNTFMQLLTQKILDKKRFKVIAGHIYDVKVLF